MSMLDRYRKSGGFHQLLMLVETCGPTKQQKFLEIIKSEDPRWADAIRAKMIDMDRIYSWNGETLAEIFGTLQDLTVAIAFHAASVETRTRVQAFFSHGRVRKIDDLFQIHSPTPQEIATTHMKIIETVRKLSIEGALRFDKFDPTLGIEDNIEDKLNRGAVVLEFNAQAPGVAAPTKIDFSAAERPSEPTERSSVSGEVTESRVIEIQSLKKRVADMSKENATLRHELSIVRSKLDQIKKIA